MRDYTKQNKEVFLSNGRCVFEEDVPKYEEQQKQRDRLIASKGLPESPVYYTGIDFGYGDSKTVIFEADAPRYESEIERELPGAPKSTQRENCETCGLFLGWDHGVCMASSSTSGEWRRDNLYGDDEYQGVSDGADYCPDWKGKGVK